MRPRKEQKLVGCRISELARSSTPYTYGREICFICTAYRVRFGQVSRIPGEGNLLRFGTGVLVSSIFLRIPNNQTNVFKDPQNNQLSYQNFLTTNKLLMT